MELITNLWCFIFPSIAPQESCFTKNASFAHRIMKSKISAFTLMEVVVVMVLSSIVISMGYTLLRLVQHEFISFEKEDSEQVKISELHSALENDFIRADRVFFDADSVKLYCNFPERRTISYQFTSATVLRQDIRVDTFWVATSLLFPLKVDSLVLLPRFMISTLSFTIKTEDNHFIRTHFHTSYPSRVYMETPTQHEYLWIQE